MKYPEAKKIMKKNFIGPDELSFIAPQLGICPVVTIPNVQFSATKLKKCAKDYILILGVSTMADGNPLTLNNLRSYVGIDPIRKEPCFYNQDWYLREKFASQKTLKAHWYLLRKSIPKQTRGVSPDFLEKKLKTKEKFPSAILASFAFFAYYFLHDGEMLWKNDFIWCCDKDKNGDRVYIGRYVDPKKINKNGFNIHRHLRIRFAYGAVTISE